MRVNCTEPSLARATEHHHHRNIYKHNHFQQELCPKTNLNTSTPPFSAHSLWCVLCSKYRIRPSAF